MEEADAASPIPEQPSKRWARDDETAAATKRRSSRLDIFRKFVLARDVKYGRLNLALLRPLGSLQHNPSNVDEVLMCG